MLIWYPLTLSPMFFCLLTLVGITGVKKWLARKSYLSFWFHRLSLPLSEIKKENTVNWWFHGYQHIFCFLISESGNDSLWSLKEMCDFLANHFFNPVIPTNVNRQKNIAYNVKGYHIYMYTDNYTSGCFFFLIYSVIFQFL